MKKTWSGLASRIDQLASGTLYTSYTAFFSLDEHSNLKLERLISFTGEDCGALRSVVYQLNDKANPHSSPSLLAFSGGEFLTQLENYL